MDANDPVEDYDVDGLDDDDYDQYDPDNLDDNEPNQGDDDDFDNEPVQDTGNDADEEDDEGRQLDQIFSEGFTAPDSNEDPFKTQSGSASQRTVQKSKINPSEFIPGPTDNEINDERLGETSKSETTTKNKKHKSTMFKGKPFKVLKAPRAASASEDALDAEEEKLKMLPDCCEFTSHRNGAYDTDESRKDMSSEWFSQIKLTPCPDDIILIAPAQQQPLCFSESLLMVEETGAVVGKYYCTISNSKWNDKPCMCVHAGSFGKFSTGLESGTSITSFINYSLKPLQEYVHEWASMNSDTIERKTFLMKELDKVPGKITLIRNGKITDTKPFILGLKERENLTTEGINLLLQRHMILEKRTTSSMTVQALSYTGKVVRAKYGELGSGWENVKGKQMKTWGIRRTVYVSDDEERVWDSLFNKNARLVLRCQPDSPQALIPLWYESVIDFDKNGNFIGSYSPYTWACDVELYSKYTVKKEEITHEHRRYILDHPEVRALLSDYLQSILFRKPNNVIEFTKQYFESFLNLRAKPQKPINKKTVDSSSRTSSYYYASSTSMLGEGEGMWGEWLGEGEGDDPNVFYIVNPKANYDGLEKVDDPNLNTESEVVTTTENETEDDLVVNEEGQYVPSSTSIIESGQDP